MLLHSVSPFGERLDNQISICIPPPLLGPNRVRIDHRFDIFSNILLLTTFVVKRDRMRHEASKGVLNVDFWTTSHANVKTWKAEADELFQKGKDLFASGWNSRGIGTLVEGIQDEINWGLIRKSEHLI